ncbi:hypothetical protein [Acidaminococcus fermentans]|uniref:hypothetical protein n=1 Tax=Acidaminococcus fermentans TaxID=905 RepID=UPI00242ED0EA|nr:hypothetical protein [Acidaminococcus fermentans]
MSLRIPWNEHEQAILLRALINVLNHKVERKYAIAEVSKQLRSLAIQQGLMIDDKFRNENGIALQMSKLEYAFTNGKSGMHVNNGWYFSIAEIYKNNKGKYKELLGGVVQMPLISEEKQKLDFVSWVKKSEQKNAENIMTFLVILGNQIHKKILKITDIQELDWLLNKISLKKDRRKKSYIEALKVYKNYLGYLKEESKENHRTERNIDDERKADQSKPGTVVTKEVNDIDFELYRKIIMTKFPRGFRIDSKLDIKRFRAFWEMENGTDLSDDDAVIRERIAHNTIRYRDFVYLPEMMASEETQKKLLAYIDSCFHDGKAGVYFEALYNEFQAEFEGKCINNADMLKSYLSGIDKRKYYIHKNYLTAIARTEIKPVDEVRDYMISLGVPITFADLYKALPYIDEDTVYRTVTGTNSRAFVRNQKGEYFHADIIQLTQHELDIITDLIQQAIDNKGYMGGKELTDEIERCLPSIMERYPFLTWLGLRDVLAYKLQDIFSFKGKIISSYGKDLSMTDIFAHFAKTHDYFTLEQLDALKQELGTPIYFDAVYAHSLRISQKDFVSRDQASFDTEATDYAISRFCTGDYIPLKYVSFFGSFPDAGFPWNEFLLEHYVACFSEKFKLLHIGFNANIPGGAIVRRTSHYHTIDDIIVAELADNKIPLVREDALEHLAETGLIIRRNYKKIEQALFKAKVQRQRKG